MTQRAGAEVFAPSLRAHRYSSRLDFSCFAAFSIFSKRLWNALSGWVARFPALPCSRESFPRITSYNSSIKGDLGLPEFIRRDTQFFKNEGGVASSTRTGIIRLLGSLQVRCRAACHSRSYQGPIRFLGPITMRKYLALSRAWWISSIHSFLARSFKYMRSILETIFQLRRGYSAS